MIANAAISLPARSATPGSEARLVGVNYLVRPASTILAASGVVTDG